MMFNELHQRFIQAAAIVCAGFVFVGIIIGLFALMFKTTAFPTPHYQEAVSHVQP